MSIDDKTTQVPEGIEVKIELDKIIVKGPKGEITRTFPTKNLKIEKKDNQIIVSALQDGANARAFVGTFNSHILNMIAGVQQPFTYKLKICSSHFPISAKLVGQELQISNFFGEKKPRKIIIPAKVTVKVEGDIIIVESVDKELAGRIASDIEQATRIRARDRRIFQDGIYIIEKAGKPIAE